MDQDKSSTFEYVALAAKGLAASTTTGVAAIATLPMPEVSAVFVYSSFGCISVLLPMWRDEFRGGRRSLAVITAGALVAAIVGPAVAEATGQPYLAAFVASSAALIAPSVITRPMFVFQSLLDAIKQIRDARTNSK